jgi:hypothetical protein
LSFSTPSGIYVDHPFQYDPNAQPNWVRISTDPSFPAGTYTISYTVQDEFGITSNTGILYVVVEECNAGTSITIPNQTLQLPCDLEPGDTWDIYIGNLPQPASEVDWSTFQFVPGGGSVTTSPLGLANGYPDNVVFSLSTLTITYTVPAVSGTDSFVWQVSSYSGDPSNATISAILLECPEAPTANDDNDCSDCGEPILINVLANDVPNGPSNIDPTTLQIVSFPSNGTAFVTSGWQISYTADPGFSGTDTFTYRVANNANPPQFSDPATVTIEVICAGLPSSISIC